MSKKPVSIPFVSKKVEDLLLWRTPKESAIVCGGSTVAFAALHLLKPIGVFPLLSYAVCIITLAAFLWSQMGAFVSKSGPPVPAVLARGLTEDEAKEYAVKVLPALNKVLASVGVLFSGKDLKLSFLVIVGSYIAARVFAFIGPFTLAFTVLVLAFSLPKLYELKQEEVDKVLAAVKAKADEGYAKLNDTVLSKIPRAGQLPKKVE